MIKFIKALYVFVLWVFVNDFKVKKHVRLKFWITLPLLVPYYLVYVVYMAYRFLKGFK